ncbi:unnamed protein product, partial [marine sediment metagenome]
TLSYPTGHGSVGPGVSCITSGVDVDWFKSTIALSICNTIPILIPNGYTYKI